MNPHDILLKKHTSENLPLENFVYRQADAIPFCPAMWHEELFVAKVLEGSCTLFVNGEKKSISQGDIVVLPPFTLYTLQNNKNTLTYPQASNMDCVVTPQDERYQQIGQAIVQIYQDKDLAHMCLIDIQNILHWLHHKTPTKNITLDKQLFVIKNVLNVVHSQKHQLVVSQLADECGYSEFYLMKLFKKFVGTSCIDYSIGYKLSQIVWLLLVTEGTFCDIANDVGFANISYCNRQFKKMFGITPKEFRKKYKE